MGSFGDRLRREREQRGISLDDIALTTKIRAGLLQALEEEKFDRLPGGIFNKGFVRAYARHLGLDEDQLVADYLVASGEGPVRRPGETATAARGEVPEPRIQLVREEPEPESKSNALSIRGILAGALVLVIVGVVAWVYYHREKQSENLPSSEPSALSQPDTRASSNPTSNPSSSQATPSQAPASQPSVSKGGAPTTPTPPPSTLSSTTLPAASTQKSESPTPAPSQAANTAGTFTVRLKADEDCWLQITSDGKTEEVTMDAGFEKAVTARDRVTVRAGSVGALTISFNGTNLPSQGDYGQVKTLVFGPQGLLPPAPKPINPPPTAIN